MVAEFFNLLQNILRVVGAEIGHAVGNQQDAILRAGHERVRRLLVRLAHAILEVGRAVALQMVKSGQNFGFFRGWRRTEHHARMIVERHDLHAVRRCKLVEQQSQRQPRTANAIRLRHGTGRIN